jgi:magnesium transporter
MPGADESTTTSLRRALAERDEAKLAEALSRLGHRILEHWPGFTRPQRIAIVKALPASRAADVLCASSPGEQVAMIQALPLLRAAEIVRRLAVEDLTDVLQALDSADAALAERLQRHLEVTTRAQVSQLASYGQDTAGGLMSPRYVAVGGSMTARETLAHLRREAPQAEQIYYLYVVDEGGRLQGILALRSLIVAADEVAVRDIMSRDVVQVHTATDQEEVARLMATYGYPVLPVVDDEGRLAGTIALDDVLSVVEEEATEDIQRLGGVAALDAPYDGTGFWPMLRKRGGWLSALFLGEMLTATAMGHYQGEIARAVVLAVFVPLVISSGGNSGSQAASLVIRALALNELGVRDWFRVFRRELLGGLALGAVLGAVGFGRILLWQALEVVDYGPHYLGLALTIWLSLVGVVCFGTLVGSMMPFLLRRLGFDPATSSAPFVATLVDVAGVIIYFQVASVVLRGGLL